MTLTVGILVAPGIPLAGETDSVFHPGDEVALNAICGGGRSGRSWALHPPDPGVSDSTGETMETIIPTVNRTDIVNVTPGSIIPCVRVKVATDARGTTAYEVAVDAADVNRGFAITDIHTGGPLVLCSAPRTVDEGARGATAAAAGTGGSANKGFSPGHEVALNALSGDGRSGRSWELQPAGDGVPEAMVETLMPVASRTDIVRIMPSAIIPCVRVTVATDGFGTTAYELAVDTDNVNRDFTIMDIHTGEPLKFCPADR